MVNLLKRYKGRLSFPFAAARIAIMFWCTAWVE